MATFSTALITPAGANPSSIAPGSTPAGERTSGRTKRGTTIINYAEVDGDDDLENDTEIGAGPRGTSSLIVGGGPPSLGGVGGMGTMGTIVEAIKRPVQVPGKPAQTRSGQGVYRYAAGTE
jgi:chromatin structure-remodeling complex subunit SFH1